MMYSSSSTPTAGSAGAGTCGLHRGGLDEWPVQSKVMALVVIIVIVVVIVIMLIIIVIVIM